MTDSLAPVQQLAQTVDFQRTYLWEIVFGPSNEGGNEINVFAQGVTFNDYTIDPVDFREGAFVRRVAGLGSIRTVTITFVDNEGGSVYSFLASRRLLVVDSAGLYGARNEYVRDIAIKLLAKDGSPSLIFMCRGAWPTTMPAYRLTYDEDSLLKYDVEFCVDSVSITSAADVAQGVEEVAAVVRPSAAQALAYGINAFDAREFQGNMMINVNPPASL